MTTGSRIRALRESRGMTQRQLAERAGCTDAAIRNYEAGRGR
ncbi:MAG: helix-turn-helix transcriptional regulator [Paratractidigestivibacter faecalis]